MKVLEEEVCINRTVRLAFVYLFKALKVQISQSAKQSAKEYKGFYTFTAPFIFSFLFSCI